MKKKTLTRLGIIAILTVSLFAILCSCVPQMGESEEEKALKANREYTTEANRLIDSLSSELGSFTEAVSEENHVKMNTYSDNAKAIIAELKVLEVPEDLKVIHVEYLTGCIELSKALDAYTALYTAMNSATEENPFDYSTFDEELGKIKKTYDSGIKHLETGDKKALEMP